MGKVTVEGDLVDNDELESVPVLATDVIAVWNEVAAQGPPLKMTTRLGRPQFHSKRYRFIERYMLIMIFPRRAFPDSRHSY